MKMMIIKVNKLINMLKKKKINFFSSESESESSENQNSINIDNLSDNSGDDEDGEGNNSFFRKNNYKHSKKNKDNKKNDRNDIRREKIKIEIKTKNIFWILRKIFQPIK